MSEVAPPAAPPHHRAPASGASRRAFAAAALVVLGLALWALYRFSAGGDPYAYAPGAQVPATVTLHEGHTYHLAIPGGPSALPVGPSQVGTLRCVFTRSDGGATALQLGVDSDKATNQFAVVVAPLTGSGQVSCAGLGPVFVAGDDSPYDVSGLLLVLATIALTVGAPLLLSVLRRPGGTERA